jgi:hypothetical protein
MLSFHGLAFHRIFGIGMGQGLALVFVDLAVVQDLADLFLGDMAAVHPAAGVAGQDEAVGVTVKGGGAVPVTGGSGSGRMGIMGMPWPWRWLVSRAGQGLLTAGQCQ